MSDTLSRRAFVGAASGLAAGVVLRVPQGAPGAPAVHVPPPARAVAMGSANGIRGVELAGRLLAQGTDTLDAAHRDEEEALAGFGTASGAGQ